MTSVKFMLLLTPLEQYFINAYNIQSDKIFLDILNGINWLEIWTNMSGAGESLTHWGRVTHICVSKLSIIGSDNGLSPGWRQAIIWTTAGIVLIGPLGANVSEILIEIYIFLFKKMHLKMSPGKW